jgi:hypothetical protein
MHRDCRLTVVGPKKALKAFRESKWSESLGARHCELLECSPGRFTSQFERVQSPLESLKRLSQRSPGLVFLVDYETEGERIKGLAKAKDGELGYCEFGY